MATTNSGSVFSSHLAIAHLRRNETWIRRRGIPLSSPNGLGSRDHPLRLWATSVAVRRIGNNRISPVPTKKASSPESVGEFRLWHASTLMIHGDFQRWFEMEVWVRPMSPMPFR